MSGIPFPDLSPTIFSFQLFGTEIALRWYALAYIFGILIGWRILVYLARRPKLWGGQAPFSDTQAETFMTYAVLGIILGGRIGYILFYKLHEYIANPAEILKVWNGGMAFHGGFVGMIVAVLIFSRLQKVRLSAIADAVALATPPGLFLGRLSNFVNAELWGHETTKPWGVIFPGEAAQSCSSLTEACARHPSQLYEAALEGVLLFAILFYLVRYRTWLARPFAISGMFFLVYGLSRIFVELFRQADPQFITPDNPYGQVIQLGPFGLSMGQALSVPMVAIGLWLVLRRNRAAV